MLRLPHVKICPLIGEPFYCSTSLDQTFAGGKTSLAGGNTSLAGVKTSLAGGNTSLAGVKTSLAGGSIAALPAGSMAESRGSMGLEHSDIRHLLNRPSACSSPCYEPQWPSPCCWYLCKS